MPCGDPHIYNNINQEKITRIIATLTSNGANISGSNPWAVNTNNYGVKLLGTWDQPSSTLSVEVTDKNFLVPCNKIWENLDPMIQRIAASDMA